MSLRSMSVDDTPGNYLLIIMIYFIKSFLLNVFLKQMFILIPILLQISTTRPPHRPRTKPTTYAATPRTRRPPHRNASIRSSKTTAASPTHIHPATHNSTNCPKRRRPITDSAKIRITPRRHWTATINRKTGSLRHTAAHPKSLLTMAWASLRCRFPTAKLCVARNQWLLVPLTNLGLS